MEQTYKEIEITGTSFEMSRPVMRFMDADGQKIQMPAASLTVTIKDIPITQIHAIPRNVLYGKIATFRISCRGVDRRVSGQLLTIEQDSCETLIKIYCPERRVERISNNEP